MKNLYLTYGSEGKEGFELTNPESLSYLESDSIDAIEGEKVLEYVPNLITFIENCYRILKLDSKAIFVCPHFASSKSCESPLTRRSLSEMSLNFANKSWRETKKFTEANVVANFEINGQFAVEQDCLARNEEAKAFWMHRYLNVCQAVIFTLVKKEL